MKNYVMLQKKSFGICRIANFAVQKSSFFFCLWSLFRFLLLSFYFSCSCEFFFLFRPSRSWTQMIMPTFWRSRIVILPITGLISYTRSVVFLFTFFYKLLSLSLQSVTLLFWHISLNFWTLNGPHPICLQVCMLLSLLLLIGIVQIYSGHSRFWLWILNEIRWFSLVMS